MKKEFIFIFILLIIITNYYFSCSMREDQFKEILHISSLSITKYEYERSKKNFVEKFKSINKRKPDKFEYRNWRKNYIDDRYLLAHLYDTKFDTTVEIIKATVAMKRLLLTQHKGYVEKYYLGKKLLKRKEYYQKIKSGITYKINQNNCKRLFNLIPENFVNTYFSKHSLDSLYQSFYDPTFDTIMEYKIKNQVKFMKTYEFLNHYNESMIKFLITSPLNIEKILKSYVEDEYKIHLADSLNIINQRKFLLSVKNYKEDYMLQYYRNKIHPISMDVDSTEILKYYNENNTLFIKANICYIDVFEFKEKETAYQFWKNSVNNNIEELSKNDIHYKYKKDVRIERKSLLLPRQITNKIFKRKNNSILKPIKLGSKYAVIYKKSDNDVSLLPLNQVKGQVIKKIKDQKSKSLLNEKISQLKHNYKSCKINLAE